MPFRDSVAVSVRIGIPWKRDFSFIKLEGKMPLFDLKCALNQPKMVQNTWNLHQISISVGTFQEKISMGGWDISKDLHHE